MFQQIEPAYLLFTIFFSLLALWCFIQILMNLYQLLRWNKAEASILNYSTKKIGRHRTDTFQIEFMDIDGHVQQRSIKVDSIYSKKFTTAYSKNNKVSIAYSLKTKETIFTESMESFVGLSSIAALCIFAVILILPMIQK